MIIIRTKEDNRTLEEKIITLLAQKGIDAQELSFSSQHTYTFPGLSVDGNQQQVFRDGEKIRLTRMEYHVLLFLILHAGNVVSKEELFQAVWGCQSEDTIKVVANTISNLRRKMEPCKGRPTYIHTSNGGYFFKCSAKPQKNSR